jgi:hypothetical protein
MHIDKTDAYSGDPYINQEGKDGKGALTAEVYAFEINVYGWLVQV